jgi:hypothetical protein
MTESIGRSSLNQSTGFSFNMRMQKMIAGVLSRNLSL